MRRFTLVASRFALAALTGVALAGYAAVPSHAADIEPQIVGGTPAAKGEFPWVVRLYQNGQAICGGAMYTPQLVLTAAHCVGPTGPTTAYSITYGVVDLQDPTRITRQSNYVYRNPSYDGIPGGDWALIRLSSPIPDAQVLPIATDTSLHNGVFTIMGWGATTEGGAQQRFLRKAEVPFISDSICQASYPNLVPSEEICAGYSSGGVDSCQGDSGSPMVRRNAVNQWVQVGIVSWGIGCARPGNPGVYAEVQRFAAAILSTAQSLGSTPPPALMQSNNWYVYATRQSASRFEFVVKTAGMPDAYFSNRLSPFLVDPWVYGGRTVRVGATVQGTAVWATELVFTVPAAPTSHPLLSLSEDGWYTHATLPGASRFEFVVKTAGMPDAYFSNRLSPFLVDPWVYGGRTVRVGVIRQGGTTWAPELIYTVPAAPTSHPLLSLSPDGKSVNATLPGASLFTFVVKTAGMPDAYFHNQTSPFTIPQVYAGKSVRVGCAKAGSSVWAPEITYVVPT